MDYVKVSKISTRYGINWTVMPSANSYQHRNFLTIKMNRLIIICLKKNYYNFKKAKGKNNQKKTNT